MSVPLFEELGLSPNEARIYHALLTYGGAGVATIALRAKIHRSNTYDTIHRLMEKGLVYEVLGQREVVYEPVDPVKFRELLEAKSHHLEEELPAMMQRFIRRLTPERAYVYKGIEGVKNYMRLARDTGQDIYTLGGKCAWLDPRVVLFTDALMKDLKEKKLHKRNLFDASVRTQSSDADLLRVSTEYKFLPKDSDSHALLEIFGDYIVTFSGLDVGTITEDVTIFVLASRNLAEDYRTWWKMIWNLL